MIRCTLCLKFTIFIFGFLFRFGIYNNEESTAVDRWMILFAGCKELSDQWNLTRIGEDPAVDVWMADVSHYVFKIFSEGKSYEQCKFSRERFIILYLHKFGCLLGVDHSTLFFYWNFLFRLLQFNPKFYLNFPIVVTIIYYHSNCSIRI